jgi:hypothetical protein
VTSKADRLFAEVDRQLAEVRAAADGLMTRSAWLLTAATLAAGLLGARIQQGKDTNLEPSLWSLAVAIALGLATVVIGLSTGPDPIQLGQWIYQPGDEATTKLYEAKLTVLGVNLRNLAIMTYGIYLEVVAVAIAVALAMYKVAVT